MNNNKNGYSKQVQSVYNNRIKNYAIIALNDLALIAQKLPEDQQAQIFNDQNMRNLLKAILKPSPEEMTKRVSNKELAKKKRERILPLCYDIIELLNNHSLAHLLAPVGTRYMLKEGGTLTFLKAIYYRSLNSRDDEE